MIMHSIANFILVLMLLVAPIVPAGILQAAGFETQTNREGSVTVKVTPMNISPQAKSWDFEVVFDTHTSALDQDMRGVTALTDGAGNTRRPLAWEGDPPGGHHRKGVLRFQPLPGAPEFIELSVSGVGGVSERVFRWRLAE